MFYEHPFLPQEEEQSWRSALINTMEALFMLVLGLLGNGLL